MKKSMLAVLIVALFAVSAAQAGVLYAEQSCRTELYNGTVSRADDNRSDSSKLTVRGDYKACKSWIKFDVSSLTNVTYARLRVTLYEPKASTCSLSVVNDSYTNNINWNETTLTWNNAPGNFTSSDGILPDDPTVTTNDLQKQLNTNQTTFVDTVVYTNGAAGDQFFFDILPYLTNDTDGIIQFVLHNSGGNSNFGTHDNPLGDAYWPAIQFIQGGSGVSTAALYNIQMNYGDGLGTYAGAAHIGTVGDIWNNPEWTGVSDGLLSTTMFADQSIVDSDGLDVYGVTATLTATYNNSTNWGIPETTFQHYTSRNDGSPNPEILLNRVIKVDNQPDPNGLVLSLSNLPTNAAATVYVYGSGNKIESGAAWSLDAANTNGGASSAVTMYNGQFDGRDVTLTNNQGSCWEVLTGTTDASGNLTVNINPPGLGDAANQIFPIGMQVQVALPSESPTVDPVIESIEVSGGTVTLSWTAEDLGSYSILRKTNLNDASWSTVSSNLPSGNLTTNVTASGANQEFYQIKGE